MRDEKVKRNFAYRSEHHPRRHDSPTFMEFVHRQEEQKESQEYDPKGHQSYFQHIEKRGRSHNDYSMHGPLDTAPVPLINLFDLLLAGALMFLFISMLLLVIN